MSEPAPMAVVDRSREVLATHARSFDFAGRFLPAECRDDAAVIYALCRWIDDAADEAPDPATASRELVAIHHELTGRAPAGPLVTRAREVLEHGGVGIAPVEALLQGVVGDLGPVAFANDRDLVRYGYRVAGTVGLMMCAVLGVEDRRALPFAIDLGIGMQITNICRDVLEDALRGRVYLPADRLEAAGASTEELLDGTADPEAVAEVVRDLLDLADRYYDSAAQGMRWIPWRSRLAILVASRVYRAIGTQLRKRDGDALAGRVWTSPLQKTSAACHALVDAVRLAFTRTPAHDPELHRELDGLFGADPEAIRPPAPAAASPPATGPAAPRGGGPTARRGPAPALRAS